MHIIQMFRVLARSERILLVFIVAYSFIPAFGGLLRVLELAGGPLVIPENARALAEPFPIALHILASFAFCIVGAAQFVPSIRRHRPATHRTLGRIVALAGCVSAASGVWMTHFFAFPQELQGSGLYLARMVLGAMMGGLIVRAVVAIRSGKVASHQAAMVRAYAIGQGASTQAFIGISWLIVAGTEPTGPLRDSLMVLGWILNLSLAEMIIARRSENVPLATPVKPH